MLRRAFTLVELLVVIAIIAVLIGILLPALRAARLESERTVCATQLRQIGNALMMYVDDHHGRLPMVVEPLWKSDGSLDFSADPFDYGAHPQSLAANLRAYLPKPEIYRCPAAQLGYPTPAMTMSYRASSANNYDGQIRTEEQLINASGAPQYAFSLKYLNGRRYRLLYVNVGVLPFRLAKGAGPYYLLRDLVARSPSGQFYSPHNPNFNQLRLDMSVSLEKDTTTGFTYP